MMIPIGSAEWSPATPVSGINAPPRIILKKPKSADALPAFYPQRDSEREVDDAPMSESGMTVKKSTGSV